MAKRIRIFSVTLTAALTLMLAAIPSFGATIVYSDITSWTAATTAQTSIQFTGLAPAQSITSYNTSSGLTLSGVTFKGIFSATAYNLSVADSGFATPFFNFGTGASLEGPYQSTSIFIPYIRVVLPSNVTGFATDFSTVSPNSSLPIRITLADGETFTSATQTRPTTTFFGLTADNPIAYVDFALPTAGANNGSVLLKDFQFGTASTSQGGTQTPESATVILLGSGLIVVGYLKRKGLAHEFTQA